jgi:hypothetical protein
MRTSSPPKLIDEKMIAEEIPMPGVAGCRILTYI